jgi:hypothetical protein
MYPRINIVHGKYISGSLEVKIGGVFSNTLLIKTIPIEAGSDAGIFNES